MRHKLAADAVRLVAAIGLVAGPVVANATPAAAASRWSVVPSASPTGPPDGNLAGVSCATANYCFAVGGASGGTLIEHWDGSSWRFVKSPNPAHGAAASLSAVSCTNTTNCFAVGSSAALGPTTVSSLTLIEHWDGTSWSIVPSPTPSGGSFVTLNAISCTSETHCFAVGSNTKFTISPTPSITSSIVIERWNGATWSLFDSPNPAGAATAELNGVSCPGPSNCFAVGSYEGRATAGALIEHWNGAMWTVVKSPDSPAAVHAVGSPGLDLLGFGSTAGLFAISCPNDASCFAVGSSFSGDALIEQWDGTTWSFLDSPTPRNAFGVQLLGVSCSSSIDCSAVGAADVETFLDGGVISVGLGGGSPVAEHWNGTTWAIVPQPQGDVFSELTGVSCPTSANCAAVGDSALAERWNGTSWSIAPFADKTSQSQLNQVACPSARICFAVGSYDSNTSQHTLIERWNGSTWSILPSPNPKGAFEVELRSIACASNTSCFAVGYYATSSAEQALIERWNGKTWSIVAGPTVKRGDLAELAGVSCVAAADCTAVGFTLSREDSAGTLIEHWNGTRWSIVPSPAAAGGAFPELFGVTCTSRTDCTAVGGTETESSGGGFSVKPLIERWNGTSWSIVPTVAPAGSGIAFLVSVSCSSAGDCLAVGIDASSDEGASHTFAEHWNGTTWSVVKTPTLKGSIESALLGVACRSSRSCDAVGGNSTVSGGKTLVEHWDGKSFSVVASPTPGTGTHPALNGIDCPTLAMCMAVGTYDNRNGSFTLAERGS